MNNEKSLYDFLILIHLVVDDSEIFYILQVSYFV